MKWITCDHEHYQRAFERLRKRSNSSEDYFDYANQEEKLLREVIVREQLRPLRKRIKQLGFVNYPALYLQLFDTSDDRSASVPEHWDEICDLTRRQLQAKQLCYEDAAPYLYLQESVEGFHSNTNIRYVIIDEAQDYSAFQFEFLKRLFPFSRMTALGDFNQGIFPHSTTLVGGSALLRLFGEQETETIVLKRSYRSTREIVEFTRAMLPGGEAIEPFMRDGGKPVVIQLTDEAARINRIGSDILKLQKKGYHSIAVIGKTASQCHKAYEALQLPAWRMESIKLVTSETPSFSGGIVVIPSYLSKGVEFDAVLLRCVPCLL